MKASIIMTHYDPEGVHVEMFANALISLVKNFQFGFETEYCFGINKPSYVEAVNDGLSRATGDFLIILNDDIVMEDPKFLEKMCDPEPNILIGWRLTGSHLVGDLVPDAACFSMSRETYSKLGPMDLRYKDGHNFEDTDYFMTAKRAGIRFKDAGLKMQHLGAQTINTYSENRQKKQNLNERLFKEKWQL